MVVTPADLAALSCPPGLINNYKTLYQFNQIRARYQLTQRPIPQAEFHLLEACAQPPHTRRRIRTLCKTLGMTKYQTRWIEIRARLTGQTPPHLGNPLWDRMEREVELVSVAFLKVREKRKIFPCLNFFIRERLYHYGRLKPLSTEFDPYFPYPRCRVTAARFQVLLKKLYRFSGIPH